MRRYVKVIILALSLVVIGLLISNNHLYKGTSASSTSVYLPKNNPLGNGVKNVFLWNIKTGNTKEGSADGGYKNLITYTDGNGKPTSNIFMDTFIVPSGSSNTYQRIYWMKELNKRIVEINKINNSNIVINILYGITVGEKTQDREEDNKYTNNNNGVEYAVDKAIETIKAEKFSNLKLIGFYWTVESITDSTTPELVSYFNNYVHSKGYKTLWIPYMTEHNRYSFGELECPNKGDCITNAIKACDDYGKNNDNKYLNPFCNNHISESSTWSNRNKYVTESNTGWRFYADELYMYAYNYGFDFSPIQTGHVFHNSINTPKINEYRTGDENKILNLLDFSDFIAKRMNTGIEVESDVDTGPYLGAYSCNAYKEWLNYALEHEWDKSINTYYFYAMLSDASFLRGKITRDFYDVTYKYAMGTLKKSDINQISCDRQYPFDSKYSSYTSAIDGNSKYIITSIPEKDPVTKEESRNIHYRSLSDIVNNGENKGKTIEQILLNKIGINNEKDKNGYSNKIMLGREELTSQGKIKTVYNRDFSGEYYCTYNSGFVKKLEDDKQVPNYIDDKTHENYFYYNVKNTCDDGKKLIDGKFGQSYYGSVDEWLEFREQIDNRITLNLGKNKTVNYFAIELNSSTPFNSDKDMGTGNFEKIEVEYTKSDGSHVSVELKPLVSPNVFAAQLYEARLNSSVTIKEATFRIVRKTKKDDKGNIVFDDNKKPIAVSEILVGTLKNKVKIKYDMNGGYLESAKDGFGNRGSLIVKDGDAVIQTINYGNSTSSDGLYNNGNSFSVKKTGYKTSGNKMWYCVSGCEGKSEDEKYFSQYGAINASQLCNASKNDCEVTLAVNWIRDTSVKPKVQIQYSMNGGYFYRGSNGYGYTGQFITNGDSKIVQTFDYDLEEIGDYGLLNYNSNGEGFYVKRDGYTVPNGLEWYKILDNGEKVYYSQTKTTYKASELCDASEGNCTVTLYVNWKTEDEDSKKVNVMYDMNGGKLADVHGTNFSTSGSLITLNNSMIIHSVENGVSANLYDYNKESNINIELDGYHAVPGKEWYKINADGSKKYYDQNANIDALEFCDTSYGDCTVTLYVNWEKNKVNVQYRMNGGKLADGHGVDFNSDGDYITLNGNKVIHTIDYGGKTSNYGLYNYNSSSSMNIKRNGYHVVAEQEWYKVDVDGNKTFFNQDGVVKASQLCDASEGDCTVTLYANWEKNKVNVQYHVNGGYLADIHGANFDVSDQLITLNGNTIIHSLKYGEETSTNGLYDYNKENNINIKYDGYYAVPGQEWYKINADGSKTYYNQNGVVKASELCNIDNKDCTITLYVNWDKNKISVQYRMNGGILIDPHGDDFNVDGDYITLNGSKIIHTMDYDGKTSNYGLYNYNSSSGINIKRSGYHVVSGQEWYMVDANGNKTFFNQDGVVKASQLCDATNGDCTVTLYANWEKNKVNVQYRMNGGSLINPHGAEFNSDGDYITLNGNKIIHTMDYDGKTTDAGLYNYNSPMNINIRKDDYVISKGKEWYKVDVDGNKTFFSQDGAVMASQLCDATDGDCTVTLYANWNKNTNILTYNCIENGGNTANSNIEYSSGTSVDLTKMCTKNGYSFVGWNTNKDATTKLNSYTMQNMDVTLYGIYKKDGITLKASFNGNGKALSDNAVKTCKIDTVYNNNNQATTCTVTTPKLLQKGYTFIGWNIDKNAKINADVYDINTDKLTLNIDDDSEGGRVWYAIANASRFKILFKSELGGTIVESNTLYAEYNSDKLYQIESSDSSGTIPIVDRDGYKFTGWYTASGKKVFDADGTLNSSVSGYTSDDGKVLIENDITLYSQFEAIDGEPVVDTFEFNADVNYVVDEEIITQIVPGNDSERLFNTINTNGLLRIYDKDGIELTENIKLRTGYKLRSSFTTKILEYKLSVKGDVLGTGELSRDNAKEIAKHVIKKNTIVGEEYLLAADYNGDNKIKMNDVVKMLRDKKKMENS